MSRVIDANCNLVAGEGQYSRFRRVVREAQRASAHDGASLLHADTAFSVALNLNASFRSLNNRAQGIGKDCKQLKLKVFLTNMLWTGFWHNQASRGGHPCDVSTSGIMKFGDSTPNKPRRSGGYPPDRDVPVEAQQIPLP